jgi:hypothetical protein
MFPCIRKAYLLESGICDFTSGLDYGSAGPGTFRLCLHPPVKSDNRVKAHTGRPAFYLY